MEIVCARTRNYEDLASSWVSNNTPITAMHRHMVDIAFSRAPVSSLQSSSGVQQAFLSAETCVQPSNALQTPDSMHIPNGIMSDSVGRQAEAIAAKASQQDLPSELRNCKLLQVAKLNDNHSGNSK